MNVVVRVAAVVYRSLHNGVVTRCFTAGACQAATEGFAAHQTPIEQLALGGVRQAGVCAVCSLGLSIGCDPHWAPIDGRCGTGLPPQHIVACICTAQVVGQGNGFAHRCVLVTELSGGRHRHAIATHQVALGQRRCAERRSGCAVIHLVTGRNAAHHQRARCHVGGAAGLAGDGVVARIGAAVAAADSDGFAVAHVLGIELPGGRHVHGVSGYQPAVLRTRYAEGGVVGAVVDPVVAHQAADRHGLGRDAGGGRVLVGDVVVAHIGAAVTADERNRLASSHVLGVKLPGG